MPIEPVLFDAMVQVEYTIDDPPEQNVAGKHFPITVVDVFLRGRSIYHLLHVGHVIMLQRRRPDRV